MRNKKIAIIIIHIIAVISISTYIAVDVIKNNNEKKQTSDMNSPTNSSSFINSSTPKNTNSSSWLSYKNLFGSGFEIKYPPDYIVINNYGNISEDEEYISIEKVSYYQTRKEDTEGPPNISIAVHRNSNNLQLLEWLKQNKDISNFEKKYQTEKLNGLDVISYTWEGMGYGDSLAFIKGDYVYIATVGYYTETDPIRQDFRSIISTIKFNE